MTAASGKADGGIDTARILLRAVIDEHHVACERLRYPRRCTFCFACKLYDRITAHLATAAANGPGEAVVVSALKTIAEFPVTNERTNLDAANMRRIAVNALLLASTPQPGMVTVPREPTKDMLEEGFDAINKQYARDPLDDALERTQAVYRAMLDAALRSGEKGTP